MSRDRPTICILSLSRIATLPRVQRQVMALSNRFNIELIGLGSTVLPGATSVEVPFRRRGAYRRLRWLVSLALRMDSWTWRDVPHAIDTLDVLRTRRADLVIAHDVDALPVAFAAGIAPVLLDAHEYGPAEFEESWWWRHGVGRYRHRLCHRFLHRLSGMTSVCQGIAERYQREFGVRSAVVMNAAAYREIPVTPTPRDSPIRLVYSGMADRSRQLHLLCEAAMRTRTRLILSLLLVGDEQLIAELRGRYASERVRFLSPLPQRELVMGLAQHDVGICLYPPISFNLLMALPNKFFDFVQARLGIVIGPSPEMARLVHEHRLGSVAQDFTVDGFVRELNALTPDRIDAWKRASSIAAKTLSAEETLPIIRAEVARAVGVDQD